MAPGSATEETSPKSVLLPPAILEERRANLRGTPEFQEFREAVNLPNATPQHIERALQKLRTQRDERYVTDAVGEVVADAMRAGPVASDPLDTSAPSVVIRRPADDRWNALVRYLKEGELKRVLDSKVTNNDIVLLPFVYSSDGEALLAQIRRRYPRQILSEEIADRLATWDSSTNHGSKNDLRQTLRGKTVYIIGHIPEGRDQQAFERRYNNGRQTHISLSSIENAASEIGFGFLPLGCDTALSSTIGTPGKITDVDALAGVKRALETPFTNWGGLLSATSDPNLGLAVNLSRIDFEKGRFVVAQLDKTKEVYLEVNAAMLRGHLEPDPDKCASDVPPRALEQWPNCAK